MTEPDYERGETVDCLEFRRQVGADPQASAPALEMHARECGSCRAFAQRYRELETRIAEAMRFDVERVVRGTRRARLSRRPRLAPRIRYAVGGALAAAGAAAALLLVQADRLGPAEGRQLAAEIVRHVQQEPAAWEVSRDPVSPASVSEVLARNDTSGVNGASLGIITYVESCLIRGRLVPHFAIRGTQGPVTLLLLEHEPLARPEPIEAEGYQGVVLPVGRGSVAIVGTRGEALTPLMVRVRTSVSWN